jgi:eukaryotic-like serine/threonine-protein kinase
LRVISKIDHIVLSLPGSFSLSRAMSTRIPARRASALHSERLLARDRAGRRGMVAGMEDEGATIAGFRLVRALRRTAEREVWVAADSAGPAGEAPAGVEVHRSLAGHDEPLAREAEAILAADHPHLLPIVDVAADAGVVVVRPLLPRDLGAWLLARGEPQAGEVVTAIAPVAAALGALHAVGAVLGGVAARDVRLDADGAPLLTAEGARIETARPSRAWREESPAVAADVADWRELALLLADACGRPLPETVERALEARDLAAAGAALLAAWPALPLVLEAAAAPSPAPRVRMRRRERAVGFDAVWARVALLLERVPAAAVALPRVRAALGGVRPRFWGMAGAGAAALAVAAGLAWSAGPAGAGAAQEQLVAAPAPPRDDASAPAVGEHDATAEPAASTDGAAAADGAVADAAAAAAVAGDDAPGDAPAGDAVVDDPLVGATALLAEREACLDAGDAACLVGLHEPASPQLRAASPWRMPDDGTLEVVQRLGDAWLLRVVSQRQPASVLVMSTEAGWTLRDAWSD